MYFSARPKSFVIAGLLTTVFLAAAAVAPAQASQLTAVSPSIVPHLMDAASANDQASATAIARKFGHPVVDETKTTETSEVSVLADGRLQLVTNSLPVRVRRGSAWLPVDATLAADTDGLISPAATSVPVQFSAGGSVFLARVQTTTGKWVTETWPYGALPKPTLAGATATYTNVLPGVDLELTASVTGMSEVFVLKNAKAAADPRVANLTLAVGGATVSKTSGEQTVASAADGSTLTSSVPVWWDSSKLDADASGPARGDFAAPLAHEVIGENLSLDTRSITGAVKYPVFIDPDWTGGVSSRWFIDKGYPTTSFLNPTTRLKLGYASAALSSDNVNHTARMFFLMDTSAVAGKQILAARFNSTETYSGSCTPMAVELWWVGSGTPGASWNNTTLGWISNMDTQTVAYGRTGCPTNAVGFNALQGVQAAAAANGTSLTLGLKATAETDSRSYKEFSPAASLVVTYNSVPSTPSGAAYTSPARSCSTDPANPTAIDGTQPITLAANSSDPDAGQNLTTTFSVSGVAPTSFSWSKATPSQAAGPASVIMTANSMVSGGVYKWHAQTSDGLGGVSAASADCYFRIVTASPGLPTVSKTSFSAPVVGQAMIVQFGSAATDGVKLFAFWWVANSGTVPPAPPVITPIVQGQALPACGSASGTVRFVCPDPGTVNATNITVAPVDTVGTLWVASYNDAGRVSLASGVSSATGLHVSATADTAGVAMTVGHIWDTQTITATATTVPDLNTTTGTTGSTTRQALGAPLGLLDSDFDGIPTTVMNYTTASTATVSDRSAIDTLNSFTVSAWLYPSSAASTSVAHIALSETGGVGQAFTLGTGINGAATFCRTNQINQSQTCAVGSNLVKGSWTMVTGVWDAGNQSLRLLTGNSIIAKASSSQTIPAGDTSPNGWFCVGARCGYPFGGFTSTDPWDGRVFRASAFPGVVSSTQLSNLYNVLSPNDDPPANESIGTVINLGCSDLITPQNIYDYNPNFGEIGWTPDAGTSAQKAAQWNGLACRWIDETSSVPIDVSAASIVDRGTMMQLRDAAAADGTPVPNIGDAAFFHMIGSEGELQVFRGDDWLTFRSEWFGSGTDADPLPADALSNLP